MAIYRIDDYEPVIPASAFVAAEATIIGNVTLAENTSVWPGAVIRGDNEPIYIGAGTNIQDGAVLHSDPGCPLTIGDNVTVGHQAMLHGCEIGNGSLIGIQAIIYNKAVLGNDCIVGLATVITEGKVFPARSLIVGTPGKRVREITDADIEVMYRNTKVYVDRRERYRKGLRRIG
jgi:carbonic anhydrase/acetyltransferase-like protein (isoleucine patch superfamily)